MRGIDEAAIYLPRYRLETEEIVGTWDRSMASGVDRRTVPASDEDAITMGIAAAELVVGSDDVVRDEINAVRFATTTPPILEEEIAARAVQALGLDSTTKSRSYTASAAAGIHALADAIDADGTALVIASDCPRGDLADADHAVGAGGIAFLVRDDAVVGCTGIGEATAEYPGVRYRETSDSGVETLGVTGYERAATQHLVGEAIHALETDLDALAGVSVHQPNAKLPYRITGDLPIDSAVVAAGLVVDRLGDAGSATVPIGLLRVLESVGPEDTSMAVGFGGGATAIALSFRGSLESTVEDTLDAGEPIDYSRYLRQRGDLGETAIAGGGVNVSWPTWKRSLRHRYRLVAGQCPDCGALTFPPEGACSGCHARVSYTSVELPREGIVASRTGVTAGEPPEFADHHRRHGPFGVLLVKFDVDGHSVRVPGMLADAAPADVGVGDTVAATVRRLYRQEGLPRYGVKFVPTDGGLG